VYTSARRRRSRSNPARLTPIARRPDVDLEMAQSPAELVGNRTDLDRVVDGRVMYTYFAWVNVSG